MLRGFYRLLLSNDLSVGRLELSDILDVHLLELVAHCGDRELAGVRGGLIEEGHVVALVMLNWLLILVICLLLLISLHVVVLTLE